MMTIQSILSLDNFTMQSSRFYSKNTNDEVTCNL
jgi:hypothetical protein